MSRFNVCVIVPKDGSTSDQLAERAFHALDKFDLNKEVPPYKYYVEPEQVKRMGEYFKTTDLSEIARQWRSNDTFGVDEGGLYGISTENPDRQIDEWEVLTEVQPEKQSELLFGEGEEKICHAIVTPDGKWIDGPWIYGSTKNSEQQQELEAWLTRFTEILEQNKDAALFLAECHN